MQTQKVNPENGHRAPAKASPELAHILEAHANLYMQENPLTSQQRTVVGDIIRCRTPVMGGHLETCQRRCGYQRLSFHSCRNRHCPKCQNLPQVRWVAQRSQKLLPTRYFHVVLTLPHQLIPLVLRNQRLLYNLFMESASRALLKLAQSWPRLQALPGFEMLEFERKLEDSWCCGSGGGVKACDPELATWAAKERIEEAKAVGAEAIVTACPHCESHFSGTGDLRVYDILQLVAAGMGEEAI